MIEIGDIRAKFAARHKSVTLIADGTLLERHEQAVAELEAAEKVAASSLGGNPQARALAEIVREVEEQLAASTVTFRFRGLGRNSFNRLLTEHPGEPGKPYNPDTFPIALIAACSLDPVMTVDEVTDLGDVINDGQFDALFGACWDACREVPDGVPFSGLASILTRD